jgi:hypothetical protein
MEDYRLLYNELENRFEKVSSIDSLFAIIDSLISFGAKRRSTGARG